MNNNKYENYSMTDKIELVANLYYISKLSQKEISEKLDISRPWVSKLLTRAEEMNIVKIEINSPSVGNPQLESRLMELYGIEKVCVVNSSFGNTRENTAKAAAHYFISRIRPHDTIGIGWGESVSTTVKHIVPLKLPDIKIVPLAGSFGTSLGFWANYGAHQLAETIHGTAYLLHAPAFCHSAEEYNAIISNPQSSEILKLGESAHIHIVGLGSIAHSNLIKHNIIQPDAAQELLEAGCVGDVALHFLDNNGNIIHTDVTERIIKVNFLKMKENARDIIGIATGEHKAGIIKAALKGKLINALFTDEETALLLCES
ncbi:hypothetical protein P22_3448 [Propionispora sp. 2/2-37]|uniref:sugar-binding transcriptional regulator n=1 Tax=Propionispora sp. 2/2-37 TaxID=1677858 RepID=UPI0006BB5C09|nr:sugar-binding domain-containing protein [Propionispora sp. 2/2-37]CUH97321.1 hypothetical protein P22_3448 [Propionispora sp. 2/2-37]